MKKGKFFVFEGADGVGKTSLLNMLIPLLESRGLVIGIGSEKDMVAEVVHSHITDPTDQGLLIQSARQTVIYPMIHNTLSKVDVLLWDRFIPSTEVYQGVRIMTDPNTPSIHALGYVETDQKPWYSTPMYELRPDAYFFVTATPDDVVDRFSELEESEERIPEFDVVGGDFILRQSKYEEVFDTYAQMQKLCPIIKVENKCLVEAMLPIYQEIRRQGVFNV